MEGRNGAPAWQRPNNDKELEAYLINLVQVAYPDERVTAEDMRAVQNELKTAQTNLVTRTTERDTARAEVETAKEDLTKERDTARTALATVRSEVQEVRLVAQGLRTEVTCLEAKVKGAKDRRSRDADRIKELEARVAVLEGIEARYEEQSKFTRRLANEVRFGRNRLAERQRTIDDLNRAWTAERTRNSTMMRRVGRQLTRELSPWVQFGQAMEASNPRQPAADPPGGEGVPSGGPSVGGSAVAPGQGGQP